MMMMIRALICIPDISGLPYRPDQSIGLGLSWGPRGVLITTSGFYITV